MLLIFLIAAKLRYSGRSCTQRASGVDKDQLTEAQQPHAQGLVG